jgi:general secretion pathway protein E
MASFLESVDASDRRVALRNRAVQIGRHPSNDIVLKDDLASRYHCVIEPAESGFRVRDLGSRNGTNVNDEKVADRILKTGDVIRVGTHEFRFRTEAAASNGESMRTRTGAPLTTPKLRKTGPDWVKALVATVDQLPEDRGLDHKNVVVIDARGQRSTALQGTSAGAVAAKLSLVLAARSRATDIHIEPKEEFSVLRIRVDGQMVTIAELPHDVTRLVLGLFRTACHIRETGREAITDGHFSARFGERKVDYRASFTPSIHGQKLVLRVLDLRHSPKSLRELGLSPHMLQRVEGVCESTQGMVLVCGPTGSGKTTTLYNCMRAIDREARNVITIEDPVEYSLEGVTQIPVDDQQGKDFSNVLRSVLRQDPDVILVGEIRDEETARTAMRAAMTGHLVFSTVHAKDTISSVFRLLDLGVEPFLVANSLNLVLAQRLVRSLCPECKQAMPLKPGVATKMGRYAQGVSKTFGPVGCSRCLKTGFQGRQAIYELLEFNDELRDVVLNNPTIQAMKQAIAGDIFTTLEQSGWQLAVKGDTSLQEVERATG